MDHPTNRALARYALGEITDDEELAAFEEHILTCDECCRRALAMDLVGTVPADSDAGPALHIAADQPEGTALCGDKSARNIVAASLVGGLESSVFCPHCLARYRQSMN